MYLHQSTKMQLMWKIPTFDWYFKKSQLEKNKSLEFKWHWLSCRLACKSTFVCTVEVLGFCLKQGIGVNTIFVWNVTTERELLYEIKDKEKTMGLNPLWKSSVRKNFPIFTMPCGFTIYFFNFSMTIQKTRFRKELSYQSPHKIPHKWPHKLS